MLNKNILLGSSILVAASFAAPAFAQETDEIIVTATKREQTLQEVPVAVSVTDADTIEKANIQDISDLQSVVPSLRVSQLQTSTNTNFTIRGFGNGANNAGIEPSVGVFIDGVYRSRSSASISDFPSLERVEVLRGPQSTLFGKNASAGVISIITKKPSFDFNASVEGTVANYNGYGAKAYVTGPAGDTVAWSLAGTYQKRDGFVDNVAGGDDLNDRNRAAIRGQMLWLPSDTSEVRVIADWDKIDEVCCYAGNLVAGPTAPAMDLLADTTNFQAYQRNNIFGRNAFVNSEPVNGVENFGISLHYDKDLGEFAKLTSITSYRQGDSFSSIDADFSSADLISFNSQDTETETLSSELRLAGGTDRFDWMVGGFYFDEEVEQENILLYGDDIRPYANALITGNPADDSTLQGLEFATVGAAGVGSTYMQAGQGRTNLSGQDNVSWSLFGTLDFYVTDRLTLTAGINYTSDEKDAYAFENRNEPFSELDLVGLTFAQVFAATGGNYVAADTVAHTECLADGSNAASCNPLLGLQALQFMAPFAAFPNSVENGQSEDTNTTWSLRAAYDVNDMINVYASASTGFKATSWNLSTDSRPFPADYSVDTRRNYAALTGGTAMAPTGYDPTAFGNPTFADQTAPLNAAGLGLNNLGTGTRFAGPEDATVYELGIKAKFDRGFVNVAVFDQTIEGFQSNVFSGTGFNLANAGEQSTTGLEIDGLFAATENLTFTFAGTFLDPKYDSFVGALGVNGPEDLSGRTPAGIHETSIVVGANYDHEFQNGMTGFVRADYLYESEVATNDNLPANIANREVGTLNASAGLTLSDGTVDLMVWGRNINDDEYLITGFPSVAQAGSLSAYTNTPSTYGFTVRKRF